MLRDVQYIVCFVFLVTEAAATLLALTETQVGNSFDEYVERYQRKYARGSDEYMLRSKVFHQRLQFIKDHNSWEDRLWTAGISHLTDRTDDELERLKGWKKDDTQRPTASLLAVTKHFAAERPPPAAVDWNNLTMMQERKNQGECGSCWAIAAATMLEARYEVQLGKIRGFSAQQLVNCVPNPKSCGGTGGCDGATSELAMQWAAENGLADNEQVPYIEKDDECRTSGLSSHASGVSRPSWNVKLNLTSWAVLPYNRARPLLVALLDGPIAVSVGAENWEYYSHGIFNNCSQDVVINHVVVLIGYGTENRTNYWTLRNSWSKYFGENGNIRVFRHRSVVEEDAACGWDSKPANGSACKPYPDKQYVCGMCGVLFDSVVANFR